MSRRVVCAICDAEKPDAESLKASDCPDCQRVTSSREVAGDGERIHPATYMTFGQQRGLFERECSG